jgi:N-acetylglucosamine-6-phosphate deacetylase
LIAPGYIDVQINGAFGVDFSVWKGKKRMEEGLDKVAKGLVKYGCTSFVPTIVSSPKEVYHQVNE